MKNFSIMGGSLKNPIFRGGSQKTYIGRGGIASKISLDSFQIWGGLVKNKSHCIFKGGWYPIAHYACYVQSNLVELMLLIGVNILLINVEEFTTYCLHEFLFWIMLMYSWWFHLSQTFWRQFFAWGIRCIKIVFI